MGEGKTSVREESAIREESAGGPISIRGRRVYTCNGRGGVAEGTYEISGTR